MLFVTWNKNESICNNLVLKPEKVKKKTFGKCRDRTHASRVTGLRLQPSELRLFYVIQTQIKHYIIKQLDQRSARTLAPIIFSGELQHQTYKSRKIETRDEPYPPNLTLVNPMVALS